MKLRSVKLFNYKSFGDSNNLLFVDDLNVVIGKNESGKSNLVEGLSFINLHGLTNKLFFNNKNKKSNDNVHVELSFFSEMKDNYLSGYKSEIVLKIFESHCIINKDFGKFIVNLDGVKSNYEELVSFLETADISFSNPANSRDFDYIFNLLNNIDVELFILTEECYGFINRMKTSADEKFKKLGILIENLDISLFNVYLDFPSFIYLNDISLKSKYSLSDYNNELDNKHNSLFCQFLDLLGIDRDEFGFVLASNDPSFIMNKTNEYNDILQEKFVNIFNSFYSQEVLDMKFMFNHNIVNILIKTKGIYLEYSERSMGLKWYVNMFIQLLYQSNSKVYNNIILLDEPGIYLHFIAQKELMSLLENMSKQNNQIIYTTHSPAMLDFNAMQNIRAVEKNNDGFTYVYNKISEFPRESKSKNEILTPLVNALGYNMSFNVGPNYQKLNIITEGITDYLYLNAYFLQEGISDYNVISSTGVNNIPAIASILYGWGCDFVILLDQDVQGRGVYDSIVDTNQPYLNSTFFVDLGNYNKDINFEIENLFSVEDQEKFELTIDDYGNNKYYYAYKCYNNIKNGKIVFSEGTLSAFENLIKTITS